ncbi:MAG: RHS repeat-associated core domain-containing protein [Gallionella sp.]
MRTYYIHSDHLDSPRSITNSAGQEVWRWDNTDPFGNNIANENPAKLGTFTFNLRFPGQYFDRETGLHYNVNRDYNPAVGRYIESDPIGLQGGINTFGYVGGNPLGAVDLRGLATTIVINNNTPIIGSHAGAVIGNVVYDPGGHYYSDRTAQDENFKPTLEDYIKYQKEDGADVQIYTFPTSKEEDELIDYRIINSPTENGGFCATSLRDNLSGIGPFKNLPKSGYFPSTPSGLGSDLSKLLKALLKAKK